MGSIQRKFEKAARDCDLEALKKLVGRHDVKPKARDSYAFRFAAGNGHLPVVEFLLSFSDPKALDSHAFCWAAVNGHLPVVQFLLPHSDPKAKDYEAFRSAVEYGSRNVANFLLPFVPWSVLKDYV